MNNLLLQIIGTTMGIVLLIIGIVVIVCSITMVNLASTIFTAVIFGLCSILAGTGIIFTTHYKGKNHE
jgi:hypothetical protein